MAGRTGGWPLSGACASGVETGGGEPGEGATEDHSVAAQGRSEPGGVAEKALKGMISALSNLDPDDELSELKSYLANFDLAARTPVPSVVLPPEETTEDVAIIEIPDEEDDEDEDTLSDSVSPRPHMQPLDSSVYGDNQAMLWRCCGCGWACETTYHGLRIHQGAAGCGWDATPRPGPELLILTRCAACYDQKGRSMPRHREDSESSSEVSEHELDWDSDTSSSSSCSSEAAAIP
ncbi:hypothetical protein CRUP_021752, partial [Coryphaenoides rupestris]